MGRLCVIISTRLEVDGIVFISRLLFPFFMPAILIPEFMVQRSTVECDGKK